MRVSFSGTKTLKTPKSVVIIDPIKGPVKLVSSVIYQFKLAVIRNCGSLVSFVRLDKNTFMSVSTFIQDVTGHYFINVQDELVTHTPFNANVMLIPAVHFSNENELEEWRNEFSS